MSPYYADPTLPAGRRWVTPGVCRSCDGFVPVAARQGVPHPLGEHLCLEHLLVALGVAAEAPRADAPTHDGAVRAAFRARLRVLTEHAGGATAVTRARQGMPIPTPPEQLEAALLTMSALGAIPLRTEPTYGVPIAMGCHWKPSKAAREYDAGRPVAYEGDPTDVGPAGRPVDVDDEAVPKAARTLARAALKAAWTVTLLAGPETLILRAERIGVLVLVRYERGRHAAAWLRGRGAPVACDAKQVGAILRGG